MTIHDDVECAAWLAEHVPDETVAARCRAGVLGEDAIRTLIEDVELAPLGEFGDFVPPRHQEVEHDPEVNCQTPSYERGHDPATNVAEHEWLTYQAIRKQAPRDATMELREYCVTCRICGAMVSRNACHVGVTRFGHQVERLYRLNGPIVDAGPE